MYVRYLGYGNYKPQIILAVALNVGAFIYAIFLNIFVAESRAEATANIIFVICYIPFTAIIGFSTFLKSSFRADDTSVTFSQPLSRKITIYYRDVEDILVYAEHKGKIRTSGFYVENIVITTHDNEYRFRAVMDDINTDPVSIITEDMDKQFETGRFHVLKQFIENAYTMHNS